MSVQWFLPNKSRRVRLLRLCYFSRSINTFLVFFSVLISCCGFFCSQNTQAYLSMTKKSPYYTLTVFLRDTNVHLGTSKLRLLVPVLKVPQKLSQSKTLTFIPVGGIIFLKTLLKMIFRPLDWHLGVLPTNNVTLVPENVPLVPFSLVT